MSSSRNSSHSRSSSKKHKKKEHSSSEEHSLEYSGSDSDRRKGNRNRSHSDKDLQRKRNDSETLKDKSEYRKQHRDKNMKDDLDSRKRRRSESNDRDEPEYRRYYENVDNEVNETEYRKYQRSKNRDDFVRNENHEDDGTRYKENKRKNEKEYESEDRRKRTEKYQDRESEYKTRRGVDERTKFDDKNYNERKSNNYSNRERNHYSNTYRDKGPRQRDNSMLKRKDRSRTPVDRRKRRTLEQGEENKDNKDKPVAVDPSKDGGPSSSQNSAGVATQKKTLDLLTSKTGGAYIPPAKLRMMQAEITDKTSAAYQRIAWEALKKSIHGHINKVNTSNIGIIVRELFKENVVRGRGLLCRSIIQAQAASPTFTHVYAALVAVINSKFPNIGELLLKRLVIQFRRGFKRNDKSLCISSATFIAHLVNQRVAHEIIALEILTLLVESPTDDSVEVAIAFLKECGMKLMEVSSKGVHAIFEMLRNILHEGQLDKRVQYMIEVIFQVRKDEFRDHVAVQEDLDLVEEEDQFTHIITLDEPANTEDILNVFKFDTEYEQTEAKYSALRKEILDEDSDSSDEGSGSEGDEDESDDSDNDEKEDATILDNTETNLVALRRTIYLTIHSSLDFEECAHKLMRMELKPGQEIELCHMFLDCCAEQRTYEKFFGLLAQRFCQINKIYIPPFQKIFKDTYDTIHRFDTNKLRNAAKFFAHLLFTDAISWEVLSFIRLNEEETTSSSRIFIKILFQELCEYMGLTKLNERVKDPTLQVAFDGLFPRDNPKNTRFAINFFTSIGLGGLTDELREHLKSQPKTPAAVPKLLQALAAGDSSDNNSDSESSEDEKDSSDSSSEEDSEEDREEKKKKKSKHSKKKKHHSKSEKKHSSRSKSSDSKKKKKNKR